MASKHSKQHERALSHLHRQSTSSLNIVLYCKQNGIALSTFNGWKQRFGHQPSEQRAKKSAAYSFVEISKTDHPHQQGTPSLLTIQTRVERPPDASEQQLNQLCRLLAHSNTEQE